MSESTQEPELSPLQQRIKDMETKYKELSTNLQISKSKVISDESVLLTCLQELMPLQNAYLSGIIQAQQKQLTNIEVIPSDTAAVPTTSKVRSRKTKVAVIKEDE
jgi:hypothetical protein